MPTPARRTSLRPRRAERAAVLDHARVSLADAAASADERAARLAIHAGADVNALDAAGRTLLTCAIAGQSWQSVDVSDASFNIHSRLRILGLFLDHDDLSLYTLNAPVRGVTPLGLAAWLNLPEVVRLLLEESHGMVVVDGVDAHATTPLMYAARDGRLHVVNHLLAYGARPDFRDLNHRSSVQYALRHPQVLWLCERALRKHRSQEELCNNKRNICALPQLYADNHSTVTTDEMYDNIHTTNSLHAYAALTDDLIEAILAADLSTLYSLLFPAPSSLTSTSSWTPALINLPDSLGWSPIHYCVSSAEPSVVVLDALYRAGADMSLYTTSGHGAPLHCFAYRAQTSGNRSHSVNLHAFAMHLARDLRAPLAARDDNMETCIHIAAEHGQSIDVLMALLACDTSGNVQELRNSRGLTAQDIAKPEFRAAFGMYTEHMRSMSSASVRTVRPSTASQDSVPSVTSLECDNPPPAITPWSRAEESPEDDQTLSTLPHRIVDHLRSVASALSNVDALDAAACSELLDETSDMGAELLAHFRARIHDAAVELRDARGVFIQTEAQFEEATRALEDFYGERIGAEDALGAERDSCERARRHTTDSGDSEATAVSDAGSGVLGRKWRSMTDLRLARALQPAGGAGIAVWSAYVVPGIAGEDLGRNSLQPALLAGDDLALQSGAAPEERRLLKLVSPWMRDVPRSRSKGDLRTAPPESARAAPLAGSSVSGTAKLKAWLLRKIRPDPPPAAENADDADGEASPEPTILGHQSGRTPQPDSPPSFELQLDPALVTKRKAIMACRRIIAAACKDLTRIDGCMDTAEQFIALASHSVAQADRQIRRAIMVRKASLECARLKANSEDAGAAPTPGASCTPSPEERVRFPRGAPASHAFLAEPPSPTAPSSAGSSVVSLASTLIEGDDGDTRALRRLLARKIAARTDGALEEIDKALTWLRIVRNLVQGLRRRTRARP